MNREHGQPAFYGCTKLDKDVLYQKAEISFYKIVQNHHIVDNGHPNFSLIPSLPPLSPHAFPAFYYNKCSILLQMFVTKQKKLEILISITLF